MTLRLLQTSKKIMSFLDTQHKEDMTCSVDKVPCMRQLSLSLSLNYCQGRDNVS